MLISLSCPRRACAASCLLPTHLCRFTARGTSCAFTDVISIGVILVGVVLLGIKETRWPCELQDEELLWPRQVAKVCTDGWSRLRGGGDVRSGMAKPERTEATSLLEPKREVTEKAV